MGKSNVQTYNYAKSFLGKGGQTFRHYCGLPSGAAWCDAFVTYIFHGTDNSALFCSGKKQTYCPTTIKILRKDMAQIPLYLAMPMDVIFFDWDKNGVPNHIGFVRAKKDTASIYTIEGNTDGGKVANKTRAGKYVQSVFRPHYKPTFTLGKLTVDGDCGYNTIAGAQKLVGAPVDAILGIGTVKKVQAFCGATQDGAWGPTTSKKLQAKMAKEGYYTGAIDGAFGKQSVQGLQRMINAKCFPSNTGTVAPAPTVTPKPVASTYTGAFPNLVTHSGQKIAYTARDLAYAKGTAKKTYTYGKGKAKAAFTNAINKVYPKRSSWSKQCQAGASCDVGAGTILRYAGVDANVPRGLSEQLGHFKKSSLWKNTGLKKCSLAGDVAMQPSPSAHIWIGLGDGNIAEANHTWKYFEHIVKDTRKINGKAKSGVYRCTKSSPIQKGDRGTEVKKLQSFLNWAGYKCGAVDGEAGPNTDAAIRAFQNANRLTVDGQFGSGSLAKAKTIKR